MALQGNAITMFATEALRALPHLIKLDAYSNLLSELPPSLFDETPALQEINLESNLLTALPPKLFKNCRSLRVISLEGNRIRSMPTDILLRATVATELNFDGNVVSCDLKTYGDRNSVSTPELLLDSCTCAPSSDPQTTYVSSSNISKIACSPRFTAGSAECTEQKDGDASCFSGLCAYHCCAKRAGATADIVCGNDGAQYLPLALAQGWDAAAQLTVQTGWVDRLNEGELQELFGPPPSFAKHVLNAKPGQLHYEVRWSKTSGDAVVGHHPPPILNATGQGLDPLNVFALDNGDIYAVPKLTGRYNAWLIAIDGAGTARDQGLPVEMDEIVVKRWTFEVTAVKRLETVSTWDPLKRTTNMLAEYQLKKVYEIPPPDLSPEKLFLYVAGGDVRTVRYSLVVYTGEDRTRTQAGGASGKFFVSQTGEVSIRALRAGVCPPFALRLCPFPGMGVAGTTTASCSSENLSTATRFLFFAFRASASPLLKCHVLIFGISSLFREIHSEFGGN